MGPFDLKIISQSVVAKNWLQLGFPLEMAIIMIVVPLKPKGMQLSNIIEGDRNIYYISQYVYL